MTAETNAHTARLDLSGKRALITGGTTGIGRAIAVLLASYGVKVFLCGRDPDPLAKALEQVREVGEGEGIALDLARPQATEALFKAANTYLRGLDIAVINAAVSANGLAETAEPDLAYTIAVDFTAYLLVARAAIDQMAGSGDIVLIGSMSAHTLQPSSTIYAGIKAGIAGLAEALRRELGPKGIRVSLVEPGKTGSDMQRPGVPPDKQRKMIRQGAMLRAEDIAVGVHYALTQPNRTVVQQLTIAPRVEAKE